MMKRHQKYYAYIDKVMIDGITGNPWGESATIDIPEKVPANALRADWWTDGTTPFFYCSCIDDYE
ncbi:MAG: hypothetical protein L6V93_16965 [Clostridiales bacterium]|nr:MAG: hypothetical protein L6V93_16965 [Clostridiales bacterium]